jgi:hypothetical protein
VTIVPISVVFGTLSQANHGFNLPGRRIDINGTQSHRRRELRDMAKLGAHPSKKTREKMRKSRRIRVAIDKWKKEKKQTKA